MKSELKRNREERAREKVGGEESDQCKREWRIRLAILFLADWQLPGKEKEREERVRQ